MPLPHDRNLIQRAKELRRDMTSHERKLWYLFLANYPVRFQRQKVMDGFIADFYCSKALLVLELDGHQHHTQQGLVYDSERSGIIERLGIEVIRFENEDIDKRFENVCKRIDSKVNERLKIQDNRMQKATISKNE